ncbi:hypothetical protein D3C71_531540 [compost metagenome]
MALHFSLDNLNRVYVSSCKRGILAVADQPMCVTHASGSSGNSTIICIKRVVREDGQWVYANPGASGEWWLQSAWKEALSLVGAEPWRVYQLDAAETAARLDGGEFTDDVRGFRNRGEPWQPVTLDGDGAVAGYTTIAAAEIWERTDGWRVVRGHEGGWKADGSHCNADRGILKYSGQHFDPLPECVLSEAAESIALVDHHRPWK